MREPLNLYPFRSCQPTQEGLTNLLENRVRRLQEVTEGQKPMDYLRATDVGNIEQELKTAEKHGIALDPDLVIRAQELRNQQFEAARTY